MSNLVAIAYIPVLHKGYVDFLRQLENEGVEELWLIGDSILEAHEELDYINRKDRLRAVSVEQMKQAIEATSKLTVEILNIDQVTSVEAEIIITPERILGKWW